MSGDFQRLGSDLLGQAIAFGRDRLGSLAGQSADGLLAALVPGADLAQLAGAAGDVDADLGRARLALQRIDIGQPADAAADLADTLRALNDACTAVASVIPAAGDARTALSKAVNSVAGPAADGIGGVLAQFGLRRPADWTVGSDPADGSPVLTCQFGNDAATGISGLLTVTRTALLVRCGLGTGRLTLTFSADADVSLSGAPRRAELVHAYIRYWPASADR
jgi:hypothetical protein